MYVICVFTVVPDTFNPVFSLEGVLEESLVGLLLVEQGLMATDRVFTIFLQQNRILVCTKIQLHTT